LFWYAVRLNSDVINGSEHVRAVCRVHEPWYQSVLRSDHDQFGPSSIQLVMSNKFGRYSFSNSHERLFNDPKVSFDVTVKDVYIFESSHRQSHQDAHLGTKSKGIVLQHLETSIGPRQSSNSGIRTPAPTTVKTGVAKGQISQPIRQRYHSLQLSTTHLYYLEYFWIPFASFPPFTVFCGP
jgi:hypothetical protein